MKHRHIYTRHRQTILRWVLLTLVAFAVGAVPPTRAETLTAGNQFYRVLVENSPERPDLDAPPGVGTYGVITGPDHPAGEGLNVLYQVPSLPTGTSYTTIHSYSSGTNYVQGRGLTGDPTTIWLNSYGTVTPLGDTGFRTTYTLPENAPDDLVIISEIQATGETYEESVVAITTAVRNTGTLPVAIGIRYLWDFQIARDDGPTLQPINPDGTPSETETAYQQPTFESFKIVDNDKNATPPTFNVFGSVTGPTTITPTPTPPDLLQFVDWEDAYLTPFSYTINPSRTITLGEKVTNDSAALLFFGGDSPRSLNIAPGQTVTVSAAIFATPPSPLTILLDPATASREIGMEHQVTATVQDTQGQPVAGQPVGFALRGVHANIGGDSGTTNADGQASFTYTGTELGSDTITAWIDRNGNEQRDPTEPSNLAEVTWEQPTAVTLVDFTAHVAGERVTLSWETATEVDNAGFNLYRASSATAPAEQINATLIPAEGDTIFGATYAFEDTPGSGIFYYWLEDVDLSGKTTRHGPIKAVVNPVPVTNANQIFLPVIIR